ncbi:FHA domain-containing protein, partial [Clavibacter michiganensis]|uniref:FHA domain-containing protein n=1 Tax=Clavibacter michiganensis TaxID=28447 RepID=UPI00292E6350
MRRAADAAANDRAHDTTQTHDADLSFVPFGADLSEAELEAIDALPSGAALLIVRSGPTTGARYLLDTDVTTVGRHPEADLFFDDVTVSRRHAEITRTGIRVFWAAVTALGILLLVGPVLNAPLTFDDITSSAKDATSTWFAKDF